VVPYFLFFIANLILTKTSSQYWSLASFAIWQMTYSHRTLKKIHRKLGANLWGILMLCIFKHISIGPFVVWWDWMPLSECAHHWSCLSACEHLWASIEHDRTRLNATEHDWTC
jgi:hypothetical protein